jgi:hypothetical protein
MEYREIVEINQTTSLEEVNELLKRNDESWIYLGWESLRSVSYAEMKMVTVDKLIHILGRIEKS